MFLADVSVLACATTVSLLVLTGWGCMALRILCIEMPARFDMHICWLGFAFLIGFLEFIQIFIPINWQLTLFVCGVGALGLIIPFKSLTWKMWIIALKFGASKHIWLYFVGGLFFFALWLLRSMGEVNNYDSGLYHFGSIRWINQHPIVPGLGNVYSALAYNQTYFLFLGLLNVYPLWNHGYSLGGLVLLITTSLTLIQFCFRANGVLRWIFGIPLFIWLGYIGGTISNPAPDTAISLLQIVMFTLLVSLYKNDSAYNKEYRLSITTLIFLSIAIVTVKLSGAIFALCSLGVALLYTKRDFYLQGHWKKVLLFGLFIGLVHMCRGYILSGAPLYPSQVGALLSLPWAMAADVIAGEKNWLYAWTRLPGSDPRDIIGSWSWLNIWLRARSVETWLYVAILFGIFLVNVYLVFIKKISILKKKKWFLLNLPLLSSIIFWFFTAPDVRFLGAIPVLLLCMSLWASCLLVSESYPIHKQLGMYQTQIIKVMALICVCLISIKLTGIRSISFSGWASLPRVETKSFITPFNVELFVPLKGNQCWNASLPCSVEMLGAIETTTWPPESSKLSWIQSRPVYRLRF